jgi:hypothetical protein
MLSSACSASSVLGVIPNAAADNMSKAGGAAAATVTWGN